MKERETDLTVDDIEALAKAFLAKPAPLLIHPADAAEAARLAHIVLGLCPTVRQVYGDDPVLREKR